MGQIQLDGSLPIEETTILTAKAKRTSAFRLGVKFCALIIVGGLMAGCVTTSVTPTNDPAAVAEYKQVNDPIEPLNRVFFEFNRGLDTLLLRPAASLYRGLIPPPIQRMVHNFLSNLKSPVILLNDLLQGEMARAGDTLTRFAINTTVGVLGFGDPATSMGYVRHGEDFGQTLGVWGSGEGMYLVLPIFGPSNPRDAVGKVVDILTDPVWQYARNTDRQYIPNERFSAELIDFRAHNMEEINDLEKTSLDYYAAVRSLYRQVRHNAIRNGKSSGKNGLNNTMGLVDGAGHDAYAMDDMADPDLTNEALATKK